MSILREYAAGWEVLNNLQTVMKICFQQSSNLLEFDIQA
jgi:hypothetical protein